MPDPKPDDDLDWDEVQHDDDPPAEDVELEAVDEVPGVLVDNEDES